MRIFRKNYSQDSDEELMQKFRQGNAGAFDDENQCSTFILRFQENLSIKEISQILDCSEGTTKSRLFYVTQKLSSKLKQFGYALRQLPIHFRQSPPGESPR